MGDSKLLPINYNVPIVQKDGTPTPYFLQWMRQFLDEKAITDAAAAGAVAQGAVLTELLSEMGGDPAANKLFYWDDTTNTFKFLGVGTNLAIAAGALNASGGGGGGGMETLLDTQVLAAAASLVWNNTKFTATYKTYLIRWENVTTSASDVVIAQVSPDDGVTWRTTGYISSRAIWGLSTNFANYFQGNATNGLVLLDSSNSDATKGINGYGYLYNLLSATQFDMTQDEIVGKYSDGNIYIANSAGMYTTAAEAHNAIKIIPKLGAGTISGTFKLYGVT